MQSLDYVILYVADPIASAAFYEKLFGGKPVDVSPTFAIFVLPNGVKFGLWKRPGVEPAAEGAPGASEICLTRADRAAVDATHAVWADMGVAILQAPTALDFGYAFTALDPDRHRVRVFVLENP